MLSDTESLGGARGRSDFWGADAGDLDRMASDTESPIPMMETSELPGLADQPQDEDAWWQAQQTSESECVCRAWWGDVYRHRTNRRWIKGKTEELRKQGTCPVLARPHISCDFTHHKKYFISN